MFACKGVLLLKYSYYYLTAVLYLTHLLLSIIESLDEWDEEELDAELNSFIVNVAIAATATEEAP